MNTIIIGIMKVISFVKNLIISKFFNKALSTVEGVIIEISELVRRESKGAKG